MKTSLGGRRIALLESRLEDALAALVRRSGGEPVCVPAVRECRNDVGDELAALLDELGAEQEPLFIFTTGVGVAAFFEEARALSREADLWDALKRGTSVCRGPKPVAALHRERIAASVAVPSPYTTTELLAALLSVPVEGRLVALLHYGERSTQPSQTLRARGARLRELLLYEWALPDDQGPLQQLVLDLIAGRFAAAAFTSQIQARHLVQIAERMGQRAALLAALRSGVVVAAVGPTCAAALRALGIEPQVMPENPKMGPMLEALARTLAAGEVAR